jgi:predicted TIM-barrel fold metal-dependent hydrolase
MDDPLETELPPGACDCHVHVIGPRTEFPMVQDRHYTPGPATHHELQAHLARNGLARAVIVQPSVYGTDNRCMLDSLDQMPASGRGIAVVDDTADDASLRALHSRGVRGLRVNVESAGGRDADAVGKALAQWAERIAPLGWHLQMYAALDTVAAAAPHIARLRVPVVLDHFAMLPAQTPHTDARAVAVLGLLRQGRAYVKLSAPYRMQADGAPDAALVDGWAAAFVRAAPERLLWGSDWPHTNREPGKQAHEVSRYRAMPPGTLTAAIARWLPTEALRELVLVQTPAELYGF